jgi:hypothetical protein
MGRGYISRKFISVKKKTESIAEINRRRRIDNKTDVEVFNKKVKEMEEKVEAKKKEVEDLDIKINDFRTKIKES